MRDSSLPSPVSFLVFLVLFLIAGCGGSQVADSDTPAQKRSRLVPFVEVIPVREDRLPLEQPVSGIARARNEVVIFPEITGRIADVLVDNGDFVEKGQTLLLLQPRQFEEQLRQAEANLRIQEAGAAQALARLEEVEAELELASRLAREDFLSEREIVRWRGQVEVARAEHARALAQVESAAAFVEERRYLLSQTVVRSPVSGVVGRRRAETGMRVDGSTQLFVVGDVREMRLTAFLSEEVSRRIQPGSPAFVDLPGSSGPPLATTVSRISPFLETGSFTTEVSLDVTNPDSKLRSGMYVDIVILYGESGTVSIVPNSALREDPRTRQFGVFLVPEAEAALTQPETASTGSPMATPVVFRPVEILARGRQGVGVRGVAPGDWVVVLGHDLLSLQPGREPLQATIRAISWERLLGLEALQSQDVAEIFLSGGDPARSSLLPEGTPLQPAN